MLCQSAICHIWKMNRVRARYVTDQSRNSFAFFGIAPMIATTNSSKSTELPVEFSTGRSNPGPSGRGFWLQSFIHIPWDLTDHSVGETVNAMNLYFDPRIVDGLTVESCHPYSSKLPLSMRNGRNATAKLCEDHTLVCLK